MNWVKTSERLPDANNDYYAVYITKDNHTFLSVALYMKHDNKWYYRDKDLPGDEVTDPVVAWVENLNKFTI